MEYKINIKFLLLTLSFLVVLVKETFPRPISYPGGWTVMQMNNFNNHSFHLHFSPSIKYSLGYKAEYWREKEWQFHGMQLNYLIKRYNTYKSQTNIYLKNGLGLAIRDLGNPRAKIEPNVFSSISFDWENRKYFISYENRINLNSSIDSFFFQKTRIGYAPYIGEYGDLHTWIMFEFQHIPKRNDKFVYTPIIRFFKGDYLAEAGLSNKHDFMINFIKRF